jgi:hypothetical protein
VRVTARDRWVLEALGKLKFARTSHLARMAFGSSRWTGRRRLRRLFDAGLVRVWVPRIDGPNVYSLTRRGAALVGPDVSAPGGLDGRLEHLLVVNTVRISLALTLPEAGGILVAWQSDWELERLSPVVPDAIVRVAWGDGAEMTYALEVDNRSRAPQAFVRKIAAYAGSCYGSAAAILVVGRDPRWLGRYREALGRVGLRAPVWFAPVTAVEEAGAFGSIWEPVVGTPKVPLRGVAPGGTAEDRSHAEIARV